MSIQIFLERTGRQLRVHDRVRLHLSADWDRPLRRGRRARWVGKTATVICEHNGRSLAAVRVDAPRAPYWVWVHVSETEPLNLHRPYLSAAEFHAYVLEQLVPRCTSCGQELKADQLAYLHGPSGQRAHVNCPQPEGSA